MIEVELHYRGEQPERRRLPALPVVGTYLDGPERRLYQVSAVLFDGPTVNVYCVQVAPRLATELAAAWTAWSEAVEATEGGDGEKITQRRLIK